VFATLHLSAVIHEYIVSVALGFAIPLLFIEFAVGGLFMYFFHQPKIGRLSNVLLLIMHGFGSANLIFHYQAEFAARLYCPRQVRPHPLSPLTTPTTGDCLGVLYSEDVGLLSTINEPNHQLLN